MIQDKSLLEFAWEELVEARKDINVMDLAKVRGSKNLKYVFKVATLSMYTLYYFGYGCASQVLRPNILNCVDMLWRRSSRMLCSTSVVNLPANILPMQTKGTICNI